MTVWRWFPDGEHKFGLCTRFWCPAVLSQWVAFVCRWGVLTNCGFFLISSSLKSRNFLAKQSWKKTSKFRRQNLSLNFVCQTMLSIQFESRSASLLAANNSTVHSNRRKYLSTLLFTPKKKEKIKTMKNVVAFIAFPTLHITHVINSSVWSSRALPFFSFPNSVLTFITCSSTWWRCCALLDCVVLAGSIVDDLSKVTIFIVDDEEDEDDDEWRQW